MTPALRAADRKMENFPIELIDGELRINGIPDAVKMISLDDGQARRLGDLVLHRHDLAFSLACLEELATSNNRSDVATDALWSSALVHYFKCFGEGSRFQLPPEKIYKPVHPDALEVFEYFKNLRNKHVVHDGNSYAQSIVGAAINDGSKSYKVEKILASNIHLTTLHQESFNNMHLLVSTALKWVVVQFDELGAKITGELEKKTYAELAARSSPSFTAAGVKDVGTARNRGSVKRSNGTIP